MLVECPRCGGTMYDDLDGRLICQDCNFTSKTQSPGGTA